MTKHCETDCREDLIDKIDAVDKHKVSKGGVYKTLGLIIVILIALWGVVYAINSKGIEKREKSIEKNTDAIVVIKERLSGMAISIDNIDKTNTSILRELRRQSASRHE